MKHISSVSSSITLRDICTSRQLLDNWLDHRKLTKLNLVEIDDEDILPSFKILHSGDRV